MKRVHFNVPSLVGDEIERMRDAVEGMHISGDGPYTKKCERTLEQMLGAQRALLTGSCTHALEIAALLLRLEPGDEVVVPSFTFVSTAAAFALHGARPVFADIRPDTLNLDERALEKSVGPRTRAVVPVHYAGVGCEMDAILDVAERRGLRVIEDNAHGFAGSYRGRMLGSFGSAATLSFHETKNVTCGEGGALLINDAEWIERAEILREKGTNRGAFFRGEVDKYTWVDLGSSYLPSDLLAAFLSAQLERIREIQATRCRIWTRYAKRLPEWAESAGAQLPTVPAGCEQSFHMYYVVARTPGERDRLIARLGEQGITSHFHYVPLHLSEMGGRYGARPGDCPVAEDVAARLLRLPFHSRLTEEEQERVVDALWAASR